MEPMDRNTARMAKILTYRRPHGLPGMEDFINDIFSKYDYDYTEWMSPLGEGLAMTIEVGTSNTLFSCHLDTVHRTAGKQIIGWDEGIQMFYKPEKGDDQCLGADDGAGIWLMLEMIDAGIPGTYIFHHGEERGGIGSTGMFDHHADWLKTFKRAIAFDRRGTSSIITHQGWGRCCSDTFGNALADSLNEVSALTMRIDDTGIFTDTANYVELIPECTNVSCGYKAEHTKGEILDFEFLCKLRDALLLIDWEALPTERVAEKLEPYSYGGYLTNWDKTAYQSDVDKLCQKRYSELLAWVKKNATDPELIADTLYEAFDRMLSAEELADERVMQSDETGGTAWPDGDGIDYDDDHGTFRLDVGMR